jgi:ribulose-phosphate 3-epimerase
MIIPVILEKNLDKIKKHIKELEGVTTVIQIDIADGLLVDNKTFSNLESINEIETTATLEIHLMVQNPLNYINMKYPKIKRLCTQVEADFDIENFVTRAKSLGYVVGLSVNPKTDASVLDPHINKIDYVQFVTVKPGDQNRVMEANSLEKIINFKKVHPYVRLQIDGGVKESNIIGLRNAGADDFVIGSQILNSGNPAGEFARLSNMIQPSTQDPQNAVSTIANDQQPINKRLRKIAILGGADWEREDTVFKEAYETSKLLAENGYEIFNGGGPGVMKAATLGAHDGGGKAIAVTYHPNKPKKNYEGVDPENTFDEEIITLDYFDRTKVILQNADVHIVFNGATGTISEFGMTWASSRIHEGNNKPIILYGKFWKEILKDIKQHMALRPGELELLKICNTPQEVLKYIKSFS